MEDIRSILTDHKGKRLIDRDRTEKDPESKKATVSEIPDLFFDDILVNTKLNRLDVLVLMFLYRQVWCRPNLHREFGIGPLTSYSEMAERLQIAVEELHQSLRKLETLEFIETIRAGQYFVRKYFTPDNDRLYGQFYDDFL